MTDPQKPQHERRVSLGGREFIARGLGAHVWTDVYHGALTVSWPKFIGAAALLYVAVNALFGLLYQLVPGSVSNVGTHGILGTFFFSIETMASVGYGDMHPQTVYGHAIASIEIFVGLFSIALLTGLIFARFSQPRARIMFARQPVVGPHDGTPALTLRVANARTNLISDATAKLWMLQNIETAEGTRFRRVFELPLLRSESPMFVLSWSIFHIIDASSPLHGKSAEDLRDGDVGFALTITGNDETSAQIIRARQLYSWADIAWNHQYRDILEAGGEGPVALNYHYFHDVIPTEKEHPQ